MNLVFSGTDYLGNEVIGHLMGRNLPSQASAGGNPVSRQYQGGISWSAVMVPEKATGANTNSVSGTPTPSSRYRMHTLVYADRDSSILRFNQYLKIDNGNDMFVAQVPAIWHSLA